VGSCPSEQASYEEKKHIEIDECQSNQFLLKLLEVAILEKTNKEVKTIVSFDE